jgi:hypothetical protein
MVVFRWADGYHDQVEVPLPLESVISRVLEHRLDKRVRRPYAHVNDTVKVLHFVLRRQSNGSFEYVQE